MFSSAEHVSEPDLSAPRDLPSPRDQPSPGDLPVPGALPLLYGACSIHAGEAGTPSSSISAWGLATHPCHSVCAPPRHTGTSQWTRWGSELSGSSLSSSPTYAPLASPWWGAGTGLARGGCSSLLPDAVGLPRPLRDADTALVMPQDLWKVWKCSCSSSVAGTRAPSLSPPLTSAVTPGVQAMTSSCCCHSPGLCDTSALTIMCHK